MRPSYSHSLIVLWTSIASSVAFVPQHTNTQVVVRTPHLSATSPQETNESNTAAAVNCLQNMDAKIKGSLSCLAIAASLWAAPAIIAPMTSSYFPMTPSGQNNVMIAASIASAKEMASGTGTRVNKDPESLLRYGLPINNKEVSCEIHRSCK